MRRAVLGIAALALVLAGPAAVAHHKAGHAGGPHVSSAVTEDSDGVGLADDRADAGDNRHPSGKDRSVEKGSLGGSSSAPDQNGKGPERDEGGLDKPGGTGGADIYDQDFNNGCGNDDDFDDDNEGWCGKPNAQQRPTLTAGGTSSTGGTSIGGSPSGETAAGQAEAVLGEVITRGGAVLGAAMSAPGSVAGETLATTGAPLVAFVLLGLGLVAAGQLLRSRGKHAA